MEHQFDELDDGQLLAVINAALDVLTSDRLRLPSDRERMDTLSTAVKISSRLDAYQSRLAARMDADEAVWHEHGTSVSTWLTQTHQFTTREAHAMVKAGRKLSRFDRVGAAAEDGLLLPAQARAVTSVLDLLPAEFDGNQIDQAQQMMIGFAKVHNSSELRTLTSALVEMLDPVSAEEREAKRVEREYKQAVRDRHLKFTHHGDGAVSFRGSLPTTEAEGFIEILHSYMAQIKRGLDIADPEAEYITPAMHRADALIAMVRAHQAHSMAPNNGGDRPRVVLTIDLATLQAAAEGAGYPIGQMLGTGEAIPAGVLRQWLCDGEIMPVVLGGPSEVLDVGRSRRLVTPEIRRALEVRDRGCVFPGCDRAPNACHAHHITPWWAGGETRLDNLVLVCPHHHGIVEPGTNPNADRWSIALGVDGTPYVTPPRRVDPEQRPRIHNRFRSRQREARRAQEHPGRPPESHPEKPAPQARTRPVSLLNMQPSPRWHTTRQPRMRPIRTRCTVRGPDVVFGSIRMASRAG